MNIDNLAGLLAFTVYVAAARSDATPEQVGQLRETVLPLLVQYRAGDIGEDAVFRQVNAVMGPDWNPSGEWAHQLDALGFVRDDGGHTH